MCQRKNRGLCFSKPPLVSYFSISYNLMSFEKEIKMIIGYARVSIDIVVYIGPTIIPNLQVRQ
jgi:hypothetical protein